MTIQRIQNYPYPHDIKNIEDVKKYLERLYRTLVDESLQRIEDFELATSDIVYDSYASHTHSGGGSYETALDISGDGQALVIADNNDQTVKITVDGNAVLEDVPCKNYNNLGSTNVGTFRFNSSFKVEHSSSRTAIVRIAYYYA